MEIHFLGTGAGVPSRKRNVSSLAVRFTQQKGRIWLFDCGEATQHKILDSPVKLSKIDTIFITHMHGDHIFGLPGLLGSRSFQGGTTKLTLYGPTGLKQYVETVLSISHTHLTYPLEIVEIEEGCIFEDEHMSVEAVALAHVMPSFAYKIIEKERTGKLDIKRLQQFDLKPGPMYQKLKMGGEVTLENGTVLDGNDFLGPAIEGRVVVVAGDTKPCNKLTTAVMDADILIHESTFCETERELAHQFGHSTATDAAKLAAEANVGQLLLTHISSRYHGLEEEIQKEAMAIFENTLVAYDSFIFHVPPKSE